MTGKGERESWLDHAWEPVDDHDTLTNDEWCRLFAHLAEPFESSPLPHPIRGSWLTNAVDEVTTADVHHMDDAAVLTHLQQVERAIAALQSIQARALVRLAGATTRSTQHHTDTGTMITIVDPVRSEIAAALRWTEVHAEDRITTARLLNRAMPATAAALACGDVSYRHAEAIADVVGRHSGALDVLSGEASHETQDRFLQDAAHIEARAVSIARRSPARAARQAADRALRRRDAAHVRRRREAAMRRRDVWIEIEPDGTALLLARMGIPEAQACLGAVDAAARADSAVQACDATSPAAAAPQTSIGERRSEALARLILHRGTDALPAGNDGAGTAVTAHLDVVIDLRTLLGLADRPASVRGSGPGAAALVDIDALQAVIADARAVTLRRLVTDSHTGALLDRGRTTYRVSGALREFLVSRDQTCRFPGCGRPARRCQMDHAVPWDQGGSTDRGNLGALCLRHHQLKTHGGWQIIDSTSDGSCRWRSPAGLIYDHAPPDIHEPDNPEGG